MSSGRADWLFNVGDRVVWDKGPLYGPSRGEGVVYGMLRWPPDGAQMFNVRWDDPGLDDEEVVGLELSQAPGGHPEPNGSPKSSARQLDAAVQPHPAPAEGPQIADLVIMDVDGRRRHGIRTYGTPLRALNGRSALQDLYEELLDGAHYVRQEIEERELATIEACDDPDAADRIRQISRRAQEVESVLLDDQRGGITTDLLDGIRYLRQHIVLLSAALHAARQAPPPPSAGTEVARYQYRAVGPDGEATYDDDSYDQDEIDRWCADPSSWTSGYYPEYRPLYGGRWYRVDPENPPSQPEDSRY